MAQATISAHLACFRDCGLVSSRAEARQSFYSIARPELRVLLAAAEELLAGVGHNVALCAKLSRGDRVSVAGPLGVSVVHDDAWHRAARTAFWLAWVSLAWMTIEGAVGLAAGIMAGSIALLAWALGSAVEGMASLIVIWRFSGGRTASANAERLAQHGIAVSFWLLAPFIAAEALASLIGGHRPETSYLGIALTAVALFEMPLLGRTKHRLAVRLGSSATAGEGTRTTCVPPRRQPSSPAWRCWPCGRVDGGSIRLSPSASPAGPSTRASRPGKVTAAVAADGPRHLLTVQTENTRGPHNPKASLSPNH